MSKDSRKAGVTELKRLHELLVPILANAALGDFSDKPAVSPEYSDQANDLIAGVGVLLEAIREKITELELVNANLQAAHGRSLSVLDEVLRKSLENERIQ